MPREAILSRATVIESHGRKVDLIDFSSPQEFLSFLSEHAPEEMGRVSGREGWAGIQGQTPAQFRQDGYSTRAMASFQKAVARLDSKPILGGRLLPSVSGGAWIIPLVLQNNPLPARMKAREKLPPINLSIRIDPIASNDEAILSANLAQVARALWDHQMAGGVVNLSVFSTYNYSRPTEQDTRGFLFRCGIPLSSEAALSLGCSVPFVRAISFPLGQVFSPLGSSEPFPMCRVFPEDEFILSGDPSRDKSMLQKFGFVDKI